MKNKYDWSDEVTAEDRTIAKYIHLTISIIISITIIYLTRNFILTSVKELTQNTILSMLIIALSIVFAMHPLFMHRYEKVRIRGKTFLAIKENNFITVDKETKQEIKKIPIEEVQNIFLDSLHNNLILTQNNEETQKVDKILTEYNKQLTEQLQKQASIEHISKETEEKMREQTNKMEQEINQITTIAPIHNLRKLESIIDKLPLMRKEETTSIFQRKNRFITTYENKDKKPVQIIIEEKKPEKERKEKKTKKKKNQKEKNKKIIKQNQKQKTTNKKR